MEATAAEAEGSEPSHAGGPEDHRSGTIEPACSHQPAQRLDAEHYPLGPIMKVKNFRINVVFASSVSVLWALVYVPEGMPIGTLSAAPTTTNIAASLYEPQQFLIASGLYSSAATNSGTNAGPHASSSSGGPSRTSQGSTPSSRSTTRAV